MGYVPPLLPVPARLAMQVNDATNRNVKAAMDVLNRGPRSGNECHIVLPQPINCRGCGANHAAANCPYCGRGRA